MQKLKRPLTRKQERFVKEYMVDLNATQAAIRAGYSKRNADKIGPELLGKTRTRIDTALQEVAQRRAMTAEETVRRIEQLAKSDIRNYLKWDPQTNTVTLKAPDELTDEQASCIAEIQQIDKGDSRTIRLKLHDKTSALIALAKYHNLFKRTVASKGLIVNIHTHQPEATRAPVVINPPGNGSKTPISPKVTFTFPPAPTNSNGSDAQPGGKANGTAGNRQGVMMWSKR